MILEFHLNLLEHANSKTSWRVAIRTSCLHMRQLKGFSIMDIAIAGDATLDSS